MSDDLSAAAQQWQRLQRRLARVAREKARLQVITHMMGSLGAAAGVEDVVQALLQGVLEHIGGSNLVLWYRTGEGVVMADVFGRRELGGTIADPLARRALETGAFIEVETDPAGTGLAAPGVSRTSTWLFPLAVGAEAIGVLRMEGMQIAAAELKPVLPAFFGFAALVLKSGLQSESRLLQANRELARAAEELRAARDQLETRVAERTAELREAKERLELELAERIQAQERLRASEEALRQSQKMEALGLMAGGVAHDLNNILQAITGFGTILRDTLVAPGDQECIGEILGASARAAELTRGLLAISRRQALQPRPVDLRRVVALTEHFLRRIIGEDVALHTRLPAAPLVVLADAPQIQQVLLNLATNARDAMPGGGSLEIAAEACGPEAAPDGAPPAPAGYARLTVSDTGTGIRPEHLERIFEPFFTTKPTGRGTGLGLSIVHGIVGQHGGHIRPGARPGGGTCFEILLPLSPRAIAEETAPEQPAPAGRGERVLVVEDDPLVRVAARRTLERGGYRVEVADSGDAALAACRAGDYDLVFLDLVMPGRNGRETAEEIARQRPGQRFLFTSGYSGNVLDARGIGALPARLLPKPAPPSLLLRAVREAIDLPPGARPA
ncbi:MAG: response regulator [Deltaproteobacteria bacterium]|nr:response regulator [Deltaproteobacteria bacterium]